MISFARTQTQVSVNHNNKANDSSAANAKVNDNAIDNKVTDKLPLSRQQEVEAEAKFLELMPAITTMAKAAFKNCNSDKQDDALQSVLVASYWSVRQLAKNGRLNEAFSTPIGWFAIKAYRSGRVGGVPMNSTDALAESTRARKRVHIESYNNHGRIKKGWGEIFMTDGRVNVAKEVCFKIDYEGWIDTLQDRQRQMLEGMIAGDTTSELAEKFRVSPGRISQIRRELVESWKNYHDTDNDGIEDTTYDHG